MKTDAQRMRDARKRAKSRAKRRGDGPATYRLSITTYIWDGWDYRCFCTHEDATPLQQVKHTTRCGRNPEYHVFFGATCAENMAQNHLRVIHSGQIVASGYEVSTHVNEYIEAHGESVSRHKAFLQRNTTGASLRFGWNAQTQRQYQIATEASQGLFLRTELLVEYDGKIGGHVWQGIGDLGIGVADVAAAIQAMRSQ